MREDRHDSHDPVLGQTFKRVQSGPGVAWPQLRGSEFFFMPIQFDSKPTFCMRFVVPFSSPTFWTVVSMPTVCFFDRPGLEIPLCLPY